MIKVIEVIYRGDKQTQIFRNPSCIFINKGCLFLQWGVEREIIIPIDTIAEISSTLEEE